MGSIEKADMLRNVVEYEEIPDSTIDGDNQSRKITLRSKISLLILILINFLNYMDRYTISSEYFNVFYPFRIPPKWFRISWAKRNILLDSGGL